MHLPFRRLLLIVAIVAFVAIAPVIVLYAIGYRPVTTTTPQPVGVAIVQTFPRKANVSINGTQYGATPRSIPNLLPGLVTIQVTKDGYQSWEKKLEIKPIQATDARAIKLIPNTPDQDIISADVSLYSASPDSSTIAIATSSNEIFLTDANGKFKTNRIAFKSTITSLLWSPDSVRLFVTTKKSGNAILHFSNQTIEKIPNALPADFQNAAWSASAANTLLASNEKHQLIQYDIEQQTSEVLVTDINNFTLLNGQIVVQKTDNTIILSDSTINVHNIATSFIASSSGDMAIMLDSGELQVLQKDGSILPIAKHALSASWSPDGIMLLVQTSQNELNIYNIGNSLTKNIPQRELHLLTRLSTPIKHAQWLPDNAHIVYETEGNIICSEIDPRDHAITNIITVTPQNNPNLFWTAKDGTSIVHIQKDKDTTNLVRTWLVTKEDR
ncbi:MAG: hypothetical protein A3E36_04595 [Candidatus Andersenbacteria bacterium RIFCSPHIGHO2_12_FULL_45_11b]|uniref:PEGA domain-containing protein n=1 Tax=Candidatus Andersenbacteria bacterium RIFCSPHIGHO2_12_FULL_45_11b TaxID=1797282 RepID=A0A1G1XA43_9BACT|nr:MAG: hypothetical protein A3E36_04595 [Candidatus Andersenbacteria bacterium RIFCSPHIGHO2_12_FULL_45_11b]